ncbi:MAG: hypothetical protein GY696_21355 [Gammaproteobacteria bacterium]|nr:hypothetical protein [Gammaproteobacteria bacterium]
MGSIREDGPSNYTPTIVVASETDAGSIVSGQTVTSSKARTESSSATELDHTDEKIVKSYLNELIGKMVDDSGDASGFIRETSRMLRQYKALRKTDWFMKINNDVNILLLKTYDLDEAIKSVVSNSKRSLHHLFYELRTDEDGSQPGRNDDTEAESLSDSSDVYSQGSLSENDKILSSYKDTLLRGIADDCQDKSEFVNEIMQLVQEYKAIRQSVMFGKLLTSVRRFMRRGYDVHDAINKAMRKRKFLVSGVYSEEIGSREGEARVASYNRIISQYS